MKRMALPIGAVAVVSLGAAALYARGNAPPDCGSERALDSVSAILRDGLHLDGVYMTNIRTLSGGMFSDRRDCVADIAQIRGGENASGMPWQEIRYRIVRQGKSRTPVITAELGDPVPPPQPQPSLWRRILTYL
jgi:hypothetical protein